MYIKRAKLKGRKNRKIYRYPYRNLSVYVDPDTDPAIFNYFATFNGAISVEVRRLLTLALTQKAAEQTNNVVPSP